MRLYLDSNVFISFVRSEIDKSFNLRFLDSERFFAACKLVNAELVLSDLFFSEIKRACSIEKQQVLESLELLNLKTKPVSDSQSSNPIKISQETGIHFTDALHVSTALQQNCDAIITWNKKDFEKTKQIIAFFSPSEFVQNTL
jgi:predicted nucleic acid-binding protein